MSEPAMIPRSAGDAAAVSGGLAEQLFALAQQDPARVLVEDDDGAYTAGALATWCSRIADQLRLGNLAPRERVLVLAGAQAASVVAIVAVLAAGLEPVVVPVDVGPVELAGVAGLANAAALIGPCRYGTLDLGDLYLSAAALAEGIRGVLTHGAEPVDGAVDISFHVLDAVAPEGRAGLWDQDEAPVIVTVAAPRSATPKLFAHHQSTLFEEACALAAEAWIEPSQALVSLLPPAGLPALLAGLYAVFAAGGARLVLHGPFDAGRFLARCDAEPAYHLLAPAAAAGALLAAGATHKALSLMLVSRVEGWPEAAGFATPPRCPIIDLQAFGEEAVRVRRRSSDPARPVAVAQPDLDYERIPFVQAGHLRR